MKSGRNWGRLDMKSEYRPLKSLVKRNIGYGIVQPGKDNVGEVHLIKVNNIISGLKNVDDLDRTTSEIEKKYERTRLKGGELVISVVGTPGRTAIVPKSFAGCNLVRAVALIDIVDCLTSWVKYYIDSPNGQNYILQNLNTTVQPTLNIKDLSEMPILIMDRKKMESIVSILSALDNKIELNDRINENLEQQAQAIYQEMIIDNSSDAWNKGKLSDIAVITMGQSPKGDTYNENGIGTVFYQGRAEFSFRFPTRRLFTTEPKRMAEENDVLMSVRAPVGDLNVATESCCIGRGLAAIHSKDNHQSFVLYTMYAVKKQLNIFNGEGTVFGSINKDSLNNIDITIPDKDTLDKFEGIVAPIDAVIRNNYDENCRLQSIRDSLLPRLMSGEIDVSKVKI